MGRRGEGTDAVRLYERATVAALLLSLAAHGLQIRTGFDPIWLLLCNFAVIFSLALIAIRAHRATSGSFDSAVAAETIVAFGVLALIFGLVVAIFHVFLLASKGLRFDVATLGELGRPFAFGLAAAGVAPVVAVMLRNFSADHFPDEEPSAELDALAEAARGLAATLEQVREATAGLEKAVSSVAATTGRLGPDLRRHLTDIADATGQVAPTLDNSATRFAAVLEAGAKRFTGEVESAGTAFSAELSGVGTSVSALADAARKGAGDMGALAAELGKARAGAAETAELFEALNDLTASVDRYVQAHRSQAAALTP